MKKRKKKFQSYVLASSTWPTTVWSITEKVKKVRGISKKSWE